MENNKDIISSRTQDIVGGQDIVGNVREITKKNWKPLHTKILHLVVRGNTPTQVVTSLGICKRTYQYVIASPFFIEKRKKLEQRLEEKYAERLVESSSIDETREILEKAAKKAAKKLVEALEDPKALTAVQLNAIKDILDRTGLKPKEVIETHERVTLPGETESSLATLEEAEKVLERLSNVQSQFVLKGTQAEGTLTDESPGETTIPEADQAGQDTLPA